jgi:hypothetical protein
VAAAIQHWLPGNAWWNGPNGKPPTTAEGYWGLIGSSDPNVYSNCFEFASLEELMLKSLGIEAQREMILATPESTWITGNANFFPGGNPGGTLLRPDPSVNGAQDALVFNFSLSNGMNVGEGAVRVGSCVYTEGGGALVVGTDYQSCLVSDTNVACTAELEALVELAQLRGSLATFQDWAIVDQSNNNRPVIHSGDQCVALPAIEPLL